jgi:short-subunit dehydrogenase
MSERFNDQVVVVTGGGRGIGRATAVEFASQGAIVVLAGRKIDALRSAAKECRGTGNRADIVKCDVGVESDLTALVDATTRKHGRIDVLVNNAGVASGGRLDDIGADDVRRMIDVNVYAPIRLSQLVLPHMRTAKSGTIVNVSSVAGRMGMPFMATYCATKYALRGFSEALRRELRPDGIHVVAVYPGLTKTDLIEGADLSDFPMPVATPKEVAKAIVRGVEWSQPEVFIGIGESIISGWNDLAPWAVDVGIDLMRNRVMTAVGNQRTT